MYKFPIINHIDDVKEAIEGRDEFIIAEREFGYVVNYLVNLIDTFPEIRYNGDSFADDESYNAAVLRECRGLIFNKSGLVIARRLHKFFNIGEKPETYQEKISLAHPHYVLEKLDGSMITPIPMPSGLIRWGTKMGITDISIDVEQWMVDMENMHYEDLARYMLSQRMTPIFEWCSRKNRIVVDYPVDRLVLIAVRDNITGEYIVYDDLKELAEDFMVSVVKAYNFGLGIDELIEHTKALENQEGYVIRFDTGHMLKIKGDWYCTLHKTKESLEHEKNLVYLVVNKQLDDLKPHLLADDLQKVEEFERNFWRGIREVSQLIEKILEDYRPIGRKQFAIDTQNIMGIERSIVFSCFDGKLNPFDAIIELVKKNCGSQTNIDKVRSLWGYHKWER